MENPDRSAPGPLLFLDEPEWSDAEFWSDGAAVAPVPDDTAAAVLNQYVSGDTGGFNVQVDFAGEWSAGLQAAFIYSAERLSDLIRSDISDVSWQGVPIDDIHISAQLVDIDGPGSILGRAGPTAIRTADYLPATAVMEFDRADADAYKAHGLWDDIVLHEMMHSIGYGTIWDYKGLVSGAGTERPIFTGDNATLTYNALYHVNRAGVPLEESGGPGTRDSHWNEEHFTSEVMTGYVDRGGTYLSPLTVASLEDLGYDTTWTASSYLIA